MGITVVYRGNFLPSWSTETHVAATLESMGVKVLRAQEPNTDPSSQGGYRWADVVRACRVAAEQGPAMFLWTQTWNSDPEGGFEALELLRAAGIPTASLHLDLYWGIARQVQIMEYPFWRTDHVFSADGGHDEGFGRVGVNHHWMPPAVYGPEAVSGQVTQEYQWPIVFVGSYPYPHPEHADARKDIIQNLQSKYGTRFRMFRGGVRGADLSNLYASARVVVGDSCLAGKIGRYWSDRIPETLGRGGFLIHPHVSGLEEHFTDGKHLRTFEAGDVGQLFTLIDHYLARPEEARQIAEAGQAHVRQHHTYRNRMETVLATVLPGERGHDDSDVRYPGEPRSGETPARGGHG